MRKPISLAACTLALALPAGVAADPAERTPLPDELVICPWGTSTDLDGRPVIVDAGTLAVLAANQRKLGRGEVALDFQHNTYDDPKLTQAQRMAREPRLVAGYGALSVVEGRGIIYKPTAWTPEGTTSYTGRHYRDLSPTVIRDETGRVVAVHSVALTRNGQIEGLYAYSAQDALASCTALSADSHTTATSTNIMDYKALLLGLLGLTETATDEEITSGITAASAAEEKKEETTTPMSAEDRIIRLERAQESTTRRQLIDRATAAGKAIPLSVEALNALPLSAVETILDGLTPGVVAIGTVATTGKIERGDATALSADDLKICELLGVSPEAYKKTKATA